jgi:hypothetical protein
MTWERMNLARHQKNSSGSGSGQGKEVEEFEARIGDTFEYYIGLCLELYPNRHLGSRRRWVLQGEAEAHLCRSQRSMTLIL